MNNLRLSIPLVGRNPLPLCLNQHCQESRIELT